MAYSIIKGNLFACYTGTTACTGLTVHKVVNTAKQAIKEYDKLVNHGDSDLAIIIDLKTGQELVTADVEVV
jgi:hypothetical protein